MYFGGTFTANGGFHLHLLVFPFIYHIKITALVLESCKTNDFHNISKFHSFFWWCVTWNEIFCLSFYSCCKRTRTELVQGQYMARTDFSLCSFHYRVPRWWKQIFPYFHYRDGFAVKPTLILSTSINIFIILRLLKYKVSPYAPS